VPSMLEARRLRHAATFNSILGGGGLRGVGNLASKGGDVG
jgi:hypothetical protein